MALKYAPTMVIGLRDGGDKKGGSDELGEMLENARSWLSEYYPQVCPIVKFGMADEQQLTDLTERVGESVKSNLNDGLRRWLEAIAEVGRLEEVRRSGFEIVGVERLNRRVILLLPPNCLEQPALTVLKVLSEASKQLDAGIQVLAMVITRGERPKISSLPLREWQEAAKGLSFANIILVHRYRSDGSTVREGDLPVVLQFLLLAALAPYEANEHWLFSLYGDQPNLSTVGVGLIYVPLTQISKAAGCYLAYQLSSQAIGKQTHPNQAEWEQKLVKIGFVAQIVCDSRSFPYSLHLPSFLPSSHLHLNALYPTSSIPPISIISFIIHILNLISLPCPSLLLAITLSPNILFSLEKLASTMFLLPYPSLPSPFTFLPLRPFPLPHNLYP